MYMVDFGLGALMVTTRLPNFLSNTGHQSMSVTYGGLLLFTRVLQRENTTSSNCC